MRISCSNRSKRGSTLAEVVIATAIIGIMAGGIITSFNYGFLTMQRVRENQRATQIMLEKAETIRLYNWDQVNTPGFIPTSFTDTYDPQAAQGSRGITYNGTLTIGPAPFGSSSGYNANLKQFTITLQWTGSSGMHRTRTLTTMVAKDGMQNYVY